MKSLFPPALSKFLLAGALFLLLLPLSRVISPQAVIDGSDIFLAWLPLSVMLAMLMLFGRSAVLPLIVSQFIFFSWLFNLSFWPLIAFIASIALPVLGSCGIARIMLGRRWRFSLSGPGIGIRLFWLSFFTPCAIKASMFFVGHLADFPPSLSRYFGLTGSLFDVVDVLGMMAAALIFTRLFYYALRMILNPYFARTFWRYCIAPSFVAGRRCYAIGWLLLLGALLTILCWPTDRLIVSGYLIPVIFIVFTMGIRQFEPRVLHVLWALSAWILLMLSGNVFYGVSTGLALSFILSVFISFTVCLLYMLKINQKSERVQRIYFAQALTDPLTQLPNLRALENHLILFPQGTLCCLRLANLEFLSRYYGMLMRIHCKRTITRQLQPLLQAGESIFQFPGSELLIFLRGPEPQSRLTYMVNQLNNQKIDWNGVTMDLEYGASWGTVREIEPEDLQRVLGQLSWLAEQASVDNEVLGLALMQESVLEEASERVQMLHKVRLAIDEEQLQLYAQPIQDSQGRGYAEILCRLIDDDGKLVMPDRFMGLVAEFNLSARFDMQILTRLLDWLKRHPQPGDAVRFSVNLMPLTLMQHNIAQQIVSLFKRYSVSPCSVVIEITEAQAFSDSGVSLRNIALLRDEGFRIAIDDFGTGYANYERLKNLQADIIKIDGYFVRDILHNPMDALIVKSICELARARNLTVVAEYVETAEQRDMLLSLGVQYLQGWLIGKPEPLPA